LESLQAWRRLNQGRYPERLADLKNAGLMPSGGAICAGVRGEAEGADSSHRLATSRIEGGDPSAAYEYELSEKVAKSRLEARWLPLGSPRYTRLDVKRELLRRPFFEQIPILRCTSHRTSAPEQFRTNDTPWLNLNVEGRVYWSGKYWEELFLADVPYACRDANVLFGLKGPPFHSGHEPTLEAALDLRPWSCAFGDHPWWWTIRCSTKPANRDAAPHLRPFFEEKHGRVATLRKTQWWLDGLVQLQGRVGKESEVTLPRTDPIHLRLGAQRLESARSFGRASLAARHRLGCGCR
jgi:hypothetical protein